MVLDTNVIVSAMLWNGRPAELLQMAIEGLIALYASKDLLNEVQSTLQKNKLRPAIARTGRLPVDLVSDYCELVRVVRPSSLAGVSRDPDDDRIIACAVVARAQYIVTGDDDLLVMKNYGDVRIVRVSNALIELAAWPG